MLDIPVASDQGSRIRAQRLEPVLDSTGAQYHPHLHRFVEASQSLRSEIAVEEQTARELVCAGRDDDAVGIGQRLKPGRQIGCPPYDGMLVRACRPSQITDDDCPGRYADACTQGLAARTNSLGPFHKSK